MKKLIVFIILILIIAGVGYFWWQNGISPVDPRDKTETKFIIHSGEGTRAIAENLKTKGLIRDPVIFFLLIKQTGVDGKIQAGQFFLSPSMTADQILQKLQVGTFDVSITIPEGKRAAEIAEILKYNLPEYSDSWAAKLEAEEGYLFPDTYSFQKNSGIDSIISEMKNNFEKKYASIPDGRKISLTKEEIVTIASMIEREARFDEDRLLVASVILNRFKIGMKLDLDATIQYALGYQPFQNSWWKKSLSSDDLKYDSPYNTYTNPGIPPAPISNPGLESLTAVIEAPETDYFYYFSDKEGHNHYAATLAEHNKNINRYSE